MHNAEQLKEQMRQLLGAQPPGVTLSKVQQQIRNALRQLGGETLTPDVGNLLRQLNLMFKFPTDATVYKDVIKGGPDTFAHWLVQSFSSGRGLAGVPDMTRYRLLERLYSSVSRYSAYRGSEPEAIERLLQDVKGAASAIGTYDRLKAEKKL